MCLNFDNCKIDVPRDADDTRLVALFANFKSGVGWRWRDDWHRHDHVDPLRAIYHVRVGYDVAFGVNDDARSQPTSLSANDHAGLPLIAFLGRAVSGNLNLNDCGRDALDERLNGIV